MTNPRDYPDEIFSAENGRPLRRGVKILTIDVDGHPFAYGQPGWWASIDDPADNEGQLTDEDNVIRAAARREARASAKHAILTPLVVRAIRETCGLSKQDAARVFGGGPKAFEKYESGEVAPSSSMTRLLLLAAKRPELFQKGSGMPIMSEADAALIRETVRRSSVDRIGGHRKPGIPFGTRPSWQTWLLQGRISEAKSANASQTQTRAMRKGRRVRPNVVA
jgi:HTH-type transcriptional regulator/antitoxin MqsA